MIDTFFIKRGDTSPSIRRTLLDGAGQPLDLGEATVVFNMGDYRGVKIARAACAITEEAGTVQYDWAVGDTDLDGSFNAEFEIAWPDGTVETVPNASFVTIRIVKDIA